MSNAKCQWYKWSFLSVALIAAAMYGRPAHGQSAPSVRVSGVDVTGIPDDWSHRHVVFTNPGTEQEALQKGRHAQWQQVVNNPRYVIQQLKKNQPVQGPAAVDAEYRSRWSAEAAASSQSHKHGKPGSQSTLKRDWSEALGGPGLAAGQYPAKFSFDITSANCTDFVAFPTGAAGSATQATIVAFNNVYSSCPGFSGGAPSVAWAYNTGGTATLSPIISIFGNELAYIQTSSNVASLVLLKIASSGGSVSAPTFGSGAGSVTNANFQTCTAPCYTTFTLNGSPNDTNSAPFYVYNTDTLLVGDSSGKLHEFTGVFGGTPAEVTTGGFPATVTSTAADETLTSPVYDSGASGLIFVGDSGGYLHAVSSTGSVVTSNQLALNTGGIVDPPIVDSTNEEVYAFAGEGNAAPANSRIYQFAAGTSINASSGTSVSLGNSATNTAATVMRAGNFDNKFYVSSNSTGNFYTCVNGALFQVPISTGLLAGTETTYSSPVSAVSNTAACSPVTEFLGVTATTTTTSAIPATQTTTTLSDAINITSTVTTGLSLAKNLTATGTTVCYTTTGFKPLAGDYILIDSEYMFVSAVDNGCGAQDGVHVTRAVNGTTGATHTAGTNDISDHADLITVPTGTSIPVGSFIQVGSEVMQVNGEVSDSPGLTLTVQRGAAGTTAATALTGATVDILGTGTVAAATGIAVNDFIQVDSEIMQVVGLTGTTLTLSRGRGGTTVAAHSSGATVQDVKDWLFLSVAGSGNAASCSGACVFNYQVLGAKTTGGTPTAGLAAAGGTSGIIVDNQVPTSITAGASEIYYTLLGGTSAIQASQAGLQ